eukprot:2999532-Prymnesium_polylepis.1
MDAECRGGRRRPRGAPAVGWVAQAPCRDAPFLILCGVFVSLSQHTRAFLVGDACAVRSAVVVATEPARLSEKTPMSSSMLLS